MTTIEALKDLSNAMGCGNAEGDTTAKVITHIAEHYTPPTPPTTNLFDIDGEIDVDYKGEKKNLNTVSDGVLTCNANSGLNHAVGQLIDTEIGATYKFSANVLSVGTGSDAILCCYPYNNTEDVEEKYSEELGVVEFEYTAVASKTLFGFDTSGGTGSQYTNISVVKL